MNQEKIGKFIATLRKEKNLTQEELAEKLNISKNAVSKWERGLSLMDIALLKPLSEILNVSILEILNGEKIKNNDIESKSEKIIIDTVKYSKKERKNKKILIVLTIIISIISFILLDTFIALISKNSPLISIKKELENDNYVLKGLLINTYYCVYEKDIITVNQKLNISEFSCPKDSYKKRIYNTTKYLYNLKNDSKRLLEELQLSFYGHYSFEIQKDNLIITYKDIEGKGNILENKDKLIEKSIIILTLIDDIKSIEWEGLNDFYKIHLNELIDKFGNLKNYGKSEDSFQKLLIILDYYDIKEPISGELLRANNKIISFNFKNNSNSIFYYGTPYRLEKYEDGKWILINKDMLFTYQAFNIKPNEEKYQEYKVDLDKGNYRLVKEFEKIEDNLDNSKKYYLIIEFVI